MPLRRSTRPRCWIPICESQSGYMTRDRRVQQTVEWLVEGKTRNWKYQARAK
jgi:hypothetical protein